MADNIYRVRFAGVASAICVSAISMTGCSHHSEEPPPAMAPSKGEVASARPATDVTMEHPEQYQSAAEAGDQRVVTVTVKDVDREQHMVTFQAKVSPEANIMRDGRAIRIDELQPGDSVRMAVDMATGDVTRVDVVKQSNY
jgi:hypothetical protein